MDKKWIYCMLLLLVLNAVGILGGRHRGHHHRHDDDDDDDDDHHRRDKDKWDWGASAGLGVLILIILVVCGLISLATWISCRIYDKCRKDKVAAAGILKGSMCSSAPSWSCELVFQPELGAGFGLVSEGFTRVGPGQLIRNRQGVAMTDGASWSMPMTRGKHVFEITWPWAHRGPHASIGVGSSDAPIKVKGSQALVGSTAHSWGLDIVRRKVVHSNRTLLTCPTDGSYVPDKFLMYVNIDDGVVGFGNEVTYWGDVITDLPKQGTQPLYVMVGATRFQAELSVLYKGSAPSDADNNDLKPRPPHHLPALFPGTSRAPPAYSEINPNEAPIMVKPVMPAAFSEKPYSPPPAYSSPPVGNEQDVPDV